MYNLALLNLKSPLYRVSNALALIMVVTLEAFAVSCTNQQDLYQETWITIFVHGIMSIKPHLSVSNFMRFMTDHVHDTVYSRTVELMRQDPVFYQNQAMQEIGLKKVDPTNVQKNNASSALAMVFEAMSKFAHGNHPVTNHYYTFGWTGLLSQEQRYQDAQNLYNELTEEIKKFQAHGITPKIRIIGYSHGGNVCLNLALVRQREPDKNALIVNELVLIGMPVQKETDYLITDPIFEKIYHIYSRGDRIQKLDFFSINRFFSRRLFKARKGFDLPDKLIQIQIKCTRTSKHHKKRGPHDYAHAYNFKSPAVIGGKAHFLRDASPGHTELWFFGWTPIHYRAHFPLNPLPIVAIMPIILQATKDFQEKSRFSRPTLIDIRPEHEIMLIKNQRSKHMLTIARFLSRKEIGALNDIVLHYAPDNYTESMYNGRIRIAYNQAVEEYEARIKAEAAERQKEKLEKKRARKRRAKPATQ